MVVLVPFRFDTHIETPFPVNCYVVPFFESVDKMVSVSISCDFDAKISNYEREGGRSPCMRPEARRELDWVISGCAESLFEKVVS